MNFLLALFLYSISFLAVFIILYEIGWLKNPDHPPKVVQVMQKSLIYAGILCIIIFSFYLTHKYL